jgi:hypothetical protein
MIIIVHLKDLLECTEKEKVNGQFSNIISEMTITTNM